MLETLIRGGQTIAEVADYLDALEPSVREAEACALGRDDQARLFEKAADARPSRLVDFVPADRGPLEPVHHPGRNTIQTLPVFQRFQKRFARPEAGAKELVGYNASKAFFIRPGYFVAYETDERPEWVSRGGLVVDYHRVPEGPVPEAWPRVVDNGRGLQRFVYHLTRDFMRHVSAHVSIGRASREDAKGDRLLDYWFILCRRDTHDDTPEPA